jgi:aspartate kinase
MLILEKFGGTSVANKERVRNVADIIGRTYSDGHDVVVVVSAQGKTTDELINMAVEINSEGSRREMDVLLSAGEQISMALLAIALEKNGIQAVSLTGWQAGIRTCNSHCSARIENIFPERILKELSEKKVVIVAGFQGIDSKNDITTMGRGGSDTSAVALAVALSVDECRIYTDVDGIYTANPRIVSGAKKIDTISYKDMFSLSSLGTQVLNDRSVKMAEKYKVKVDIISSLACSPGTNVCELSPACKHSIIGISVDDNVILVRGGIDLISKLFDGNVPIVNICDNNILIRENFAASVKKISEIFENVSKVSVVFSNKEPYAKIAKEIIEVTKNFDIKAIFMNETAVSVVIPREKVCEITEKIHNKFF